MFRGNTVLHDASCFIGCLPELSNNKNHPSTTSYALPRHDCFNVLQGRNEVRWRLGQEASLAPPCSNLRCFGSKCTVLQKILVTLLGLLGAARSDSAPP